MAIPKTEEKLKKKNLNPEEFKQKMLDDFSKLSSIYSDDMKQKILNELPNFSNPSGDNSLYGEREKRSKLVTEILCKYKESFANKVDDTPKFRRVLLYSTLGIMFGLTACFILYSLKIMFMQTEMKTTQFASFASASVTMLGTVFGLLTIITNYFFPKDDEQYLATIVQAVQENDFRLGHDK